MSALARFDGIGDDAASDDAGRGVRAPAAEGAGSMWLLPALLVGVVLLAVATGAHAGLYKWVDEHGIVHYSDRLPPDAVNRASTQLNREGVVVKQIGQAPTAAEQQAREAQEKQKREQERERMLAERRDRALLDSYTNESDIDLAKARALATIEGQITSARAYVAQIAKRQAQLEAQKAGSGSRSVPTAIASELASIDAELARQAAFIAGKQKDAAATAARYDADKRRFHELKSSATGGLGESSPTRLSAAQPAPGVPRY
ncbi:MAG TPA: DUF4124 domain-containing protein [Casimicrobiaceae bacterium]|nr:DUF4124 domain-containing protein [Casimicrobiaceae bacterium]